MFLIPKLVAAAMVLSAVSPALSSPVSVSSASVQDVGQMLRAWDLHDTFGEAFEAHEVDGDSILNFFKKGRVDQRTFAPGASQQQWNRLWTQVAQLVHTETARRLASAAASSLETGIAIGHDNAAIRFQDAKLSRSGAGQLLISNASLYQTGSGGTAASVLTEAEAESFIDSYIDTALEGVAANRRCADGLTGDFCNETCTKKLYSAFASCFYHDAAATDLQIVEASAYIGYKDPTTSVASVQCCDDDTCTRKDSNGDCWMGSRDDTDPFAIFTDFYTAKEMCEDAGMRLCTKDEMLEVGHDCCGGGCSYDYTVAWIDDFVYDC